MNKKIDEAYNLLENMSLNHYQWSNNRGSSQKKIPRKYVDALDIITTNVDALTQKI